MIFSKNSALHIFAAALSALVILFGISYTTKAVEAGPDWIGGSVTFESAGDYAYQDGDQYYMLANILSESVTAQVNDGSLLNPRLRDSTYGAYPTSVGYFDGYRALPIGETRWQTINRGDYAWSEFIGNPGDAGALVFINNAPYNQGPRSLHYIPDWRVMFGKLTANYQGNISRSVSSDFDIDSTPVLKGPDGSVLAERTTAAPAFSKNGQWLYLNSGVGQIRARIPDLSYEIVGPRLADMYSIYSAVSNDGRYVVSASYANKLTIYDTSDCEAGICQKRNLYDTLKTEYSNTLPAGAGPVDPVIKGMKFVNDSKLEIYAWIERRDGVKGYAKIYLSVDAGVQPVRYLALGDSFSSGEGVGNYYEATNFYADADNYNFCHQSRVAYSELLNKAITPDWYDSVACSGAQMKDVVFGKEDDYINTDNWQAKSVEETTRLIQRVKQSNLPGYIPQLSLVQQNSPSIVTMSLGGNDIGFKDIIMACIANIECYRARDDREKLADLITSKTNKLVSTFTDIKNNMDGESPKLYVLGYPQLFAERVCGSFMSIDEQAFANHLVDYLNEIIKIAASRAGVFYVDVSHAFVDDAVNEDHRLCGNAQQAANGAFFDANNMPRAPFLEAFSRALVSSYHPNALGHQLLARIICEQTASFEKAALGLGTIDESEYMTYYVQLVGDSDDTQQELIDVSENITKDTVVESGQSVSVSYSLGSDDNGLPVQDATITVVAQSSPAILGTLSVQLDNTVSGEFTLPESLEPGVHTIHLLYTDISGQKHDIYQYVYVIASVSDIDGDGILNEDEACVIGGTMGVDSDDDGIDDACDSEFTIAIPGQDDKGEGAPVTDETSGEEIQSPATLGTKDILSEEVETTLGTSTIFSVLPTASPTTNASDIEAANASDEVDKSIASATQQRADVIQYVALVVTVLIIVIAVTMYFAKRKQF